MVDTEGKVNCISDLKKKKIYVVFKTIPQPKNKKGEKVKDKKIPFQLNGKTAKINDPATWDQYEACREAVKLGKYKALAFALTQGLGVVAIDIDDCFDDQGQLKPEKKEVVIDILTHTANSYVEISLSGKGLHILILGNLPRDEHGEVRSRKGNVEIYDDRRFIILTENIYEGRKDLVADQSAINYVYYNYVYEAESEEAKSRKPMPAAKVRKTVAGTIAEKYTQLWNGNWEQALNEKGQPFESLSEAVMSLCSYIARHVSDETQLDRIFKQSGLFKECEKAEAGKWDRTKKYLFPKLFTYQGNYTNFSDQPMSLKCGNWIADDKGVRTINEKTQKSDVACTHAILPVGVVEDLSAEKVKTLKPDKGTKIKLAFRKSNRPWIFIMVDKGIVSSSSRILELTRFNIDVDSDTAKFLVRYISCVLSLNKDLPVSTAIKHYGWHGSEFAPYSKNVEVDTEKFGDIVEAITEKGDADEWIRFYKPLLNSCLPLRLITDASLASALIEPCNLQSFCVHTWGSTETGKTTILQIAASLWGKPTSDNGNSYLMSLSSTANALLSRAATLQSMPLCADERQAVDKRYGVDVNTFIMQFCGELNRARSSVTGHELTTRTWKSTLLTTGEQPFLDTRTGGGAANRVIEMPVNKALFDVSRIREIKKNLKTQYGTLGKKFIEMVQESLPDLVQYHAELYNELKKACLEYNEIGSTSKQLNAGAAILLADRMLSVITGVKPLTATHLAPLMKTRIDVDVSFRIYSLIQTFIASNKNKILASPENYEQDGRVLDVVGKLGPQNSTYIIKTKLDDFLEKYGYDISAVAETLAKNKLIETYVNHNKNRSRVRYTVPIKIGTARNVVCIKVLDKKIEDQYQEQGSQDTQN